MSQRQDVQSFINQHPFSRFQWFIFALCFVIVLLDGFDTAAIGYIAPSLIQEWGVTKPALAPVLSAALFGLAAGALSAGPLADRLGRKGVLIGSVLVFGVSCLVSAFSGSLEMLTVMRFLTGLGLGAAMPNAVTLMSEYCPSRRRAMLTNAMFCGFPLGAAVRFSWWFTSISHKFNDDPIEHKIQLAELDYLMSSTAGQTTIAENYVGLPFDPTFE